MLPLAARVRHLETGLCGRVLGDRAPPQRRRGPECGTARGPVAICCRLGRYLHRQILATALRPVLTTGNNCGLPEGRRRVPVLDAHGCTPSPQPGQAPLSVDLRGHTRGRPAPRLIPSAHPDNHPGC